MVDGPVSRAAAAFAAGVVTCITSVLVCWPDAPAEPGYPFTSALQGAFLPVFVAFGPLVAIAVSLWSRHSWPFALGMIVPFAAALLAEVAADPTNHNLFPFEVLFVWLPAFILSWGAGAVALFVASRARRGR